MQSYQDHLPMGQPETLDLESGMKVVEQIKEAFNRGADEIKIFKPTKAQLKNMTRRELKRTRKNFNEAQRNSVQQP